MRKRIIGQPAPVVAPAGRSWLDVERLAQVEITSEDPTHPIESALRPGAGPGWQAAGPGEQTIRLVFDAPLSLRRIHFVLREDQHARTQEFALRWSPDGGQSAPICTLPPASPVVHQHWMGDAGTPKARLTHTNPAYHYAMDGGVSSQAGQEDAHWRW